VDPHKYTRFPESTVLALSAASRQWLNGLDLPSASDRCEE
jgi:hypothetical protein